MKPEHIDDAYECIILTLNTNNITTVLWVNIANKSIIVILVGAL